MPELLKDLVNWLTQPVQYFTLSCVLFALMMVTRRWVKPRFALLVLIASTVFLALSMTDPDFRLIVTKPDNIPIVMLLLVVGFFTWLSFYQAFANDDRIAQGQPPEEAEDSARRVWTWPDLLYVEFVCAILFAVFLVVWSIVIKAPLEEPANPTNTPNPSKAPWYFLGLQEMLVYFDPWIAGVVLPTLIIVGLMAIPYLDTNPKGNGYYTFQERRWEIGIYMFGFVVLWVLLIILGTFLRGPNWNFFGPYEYWDVHKLEPLNNVDLSEFLWIRLLGTRLPDFWLIRELPGILMVLGYMFALPVLLARTWFKRFHDKMGPARYYIAMIAFFLPMLALPIKMVLRWTFNLKYIVHIHEFFFNI